MAMAIISNYSSRPLILFFLLLLAFFFQLATIASSSFLHKQHQQRLDSNLFFKNYDKLNYDTAELNRKHLRVQRSLDDHILLSFKGYGKTFNLKLRPVEQNYFDHDSIELMHEKDDDESKTTKHQISNLLLLYEGELIDPEEQSSKVRGTVINGLFLGTIETTSDGKFVVESLARYQNLKDDDYDDENSGHHSIIYHENDVRTGEEFQELKQSSNRTNVGVGCGSRHSRINEQLRKMQEIKLQHQHGNTSAEHNKITSLNQNHRRSKRATQLNFPNGNQQSTCNLYLKVDPSLYTLVYNNEGEQNPTLTTSYLLYFINEQVNAINTIYNPLNFYDTTGTYYYTGVNFRISRTKIYTPAECSSSSSGLTAAEISICTGNLDVTNYLNAISNDDYSSYCLGFAFSARDFGDGSLGLAWIASTSPSTAGGICQKPVSIQGVTKSLNAGTSTLVSYGTRVPIIVAQLTMAHEVGHGFGSTHDTDGTSCAPGDSNGGNYIMNAHASPGTLPNNNKFSSCSLSLMGAVLNYVVGSSRFCFISKTSAICGNNIVETGEQCDCGYSDSCKDSCCYPAGTSNGCKLQPGATCSPTDGPCCLSSCSYASSTFVCLSSSDCMANTYCTGTSSSCPSTNANLFKPNLTTCDNGNQVCISGSCTGSICLKYGLNECQLSGNPLSQSTDLTALCHVGCNGTLTSNVCVDSFQIPFILSQNNNTGYFLKIGSPCANSMGYCDIFNKCRYYNGNAPLSRLTAFLIAPQQTIDELEAWLATYWWVIFIAVIVFLALVAIFVHYDRKPLP